MAQKATSGISIDKWCASERSLPTLTGSPWLPSSEALVQLTPHFGDQSTAEYEITLVLRQNDLRCLNCYRTSWVDWGRRLVSFLCWTHIEWTRAPVNRMGLRPRIASECSLPATITWMRNSRGIRPLGFTQVRLGQTGSILYFWRYDLERIWPTVFLSVSESAPRAAQEPPSETPKLLEGPRQQRQELLQLPEEPQHEPAAKWRPEQAEEWLKETMHSSPQKPGESKNEWAKRLYNDHMKYDFEDKPPWGEWQTLRRYMNPRTRTKKIFDQDS